MNHRQTRHAPQRTPVAPLYRGPQAIQSAQQSPFQHAPNAALLIDFDNVTMGIRSDLAGELRNLLSSEIIRGKVAVQRAYADWRRYPQYIVPLAEASIDMIMAPAYGSSKKNATDIRLAVDAVELVFTRPEIGTYILLSGDSDFASMVTKLKEYGKYVIGVGIRESSSDLLVMNCDEYYSYNALAGLVKASEEEVVKWDPWELVIEAINRMVRNGDVMRSDRLKQVMQDIDPQFDEKNLGMSKFSKFCQEAASQGLLKVTKLENGQLEVSPGEQAAKAGTGGTPSPRGPSAVARPAENGDREERGRRGRRGGRGRGRETRDERHRDGKPRDEIAREEVTGVALTPDEAAPDSAPRIGHSGERLTREEALGLVRRSAESMITGDGHVAASALRTRAFELLGRDSESLNERFFDRVLRDAHDEHHIDLRRRGNDYEVSLPAQVAPVAEQLNRAAAAHASPAPATGVPRRGMGPRGIPAKGRAGGRAGAPPADLLAVGVVDHAPMGGVTVKTAPAEVPPPAEGAAAPKKKKARGRPGRKTSAKAAPAAEPVPATHAEAGTVEGATAAKKRSRAPRKKKVAAAGAKDG
ncbi:MAG TPA: NYN domain-containing protein [Gemmatimonadaceae bacterium]